MIKITVQNYSILINRRILLIEGNSFRVRGISTSIWWIFYFNEESSSFHWWRKLPFKKNFITFLKKNDFARIFFIGIKQKFTNRRFFFSKSKKRFSTIFSAQVLHSTFSKVQKKDRYDTYVTFWLLVWGNLKLSAWQEDKSGARRPCWLWVVATGFESEAPTLEPLSIWQGWHSMNRSRYLKQFKI